jgi:hypothetical protein
MTRIFIISLFSLYGASLMSMNQEIAGTADALPRPTKFAFVQDKTGTVWHVQATEENPKLGETITVVVPINNESYIVEGKIVAITIDHGSKHAHLH